MSWQIAGLFCFVFVLRCSRTLPGPRRTCNASPPTPVRDRKERKGKGTCPPPESFAPQPGAVLPPQQHVRGGSCPKTLVCDGRTSVSTAAGGQVSAHRASLAWSNSARISLRAEGTAMRGGAGVRGQARREARRGTVLRGARRRGAAFRGARGGARRRGAALRARTGAIIPLLPPHPHPPAAAPGGLCAELVLGVGHGRPARVAQRDQHAAGGAVPLVAPLQQPRVAAVPGGGGLQEGSGGEEAARDQWEGGEQAAKGRGKGSGKAAKGHGKASVFAMKRPKKRPTTKAPGRRGCVADLLVGGLAAVPGLYLGRGRHLIGRALGGSGGLHAPIGTSELAVCDRFCMQSTQGWCGGQTDDEGTGTGRERERQ